MGVQELSRGNRQQQSFFINGRYFRDDYVSRALERAVEGYVMIGRFPICALNLKMPYEQVDVNVHPNKLEVRFQNPAGVMEAIETVVREALQTETIVEKLIPPIASHTLVTENIEVVTLPEETEETADESILLPYAKPEEGNRLVLRETVQPWFSEPEDMQSEPLPEPARPEPVQEVISGVVGELRLRYIGAVFHTYLLFEAEERLLLIDQHAAHERILFDRFMARYQSEHISQRLITPLLLSFPAKDVNTILEMRNDLEAVGFAIDAFDATAVAGACHAGYIGRERTHARIAGGYGG